VGWYKVTLGFRDIEKMKSLEDVTDPHTWPRQGCSFGEENGLEIMAEFGWGEEDRLTVRIVELNL